MLPAEKHLVEDDGQQQRPSCEVADIFREYGEPYRVNHPLPPTHLKVMQDIERCRTAELGGHLEKCDRCAAERNAYNSCRNRHCPKCQASAKARWLEARKAELLPVTYFHNVFTLPHEINPVALCNKKEVFDILFKAASETLLLFGKNPKNGLGGALGFIAILHTWSQTLLDHLHVHCLIPGGAVSLDGSHWIASKADFLFRVEALSEVFRGKFMHQLDKAFAKGKLIFPGNTAHYGTEKGFVRLKNQLWAKDWVVYSKQPFAGPEKVLDYLGRYTHRVAIANHRIIKSEQATVTFSYTDRKDNDKVKLMPLEAEEFIRRFLLHVLPDGFVRIRHFGFLANRSKKKNLGNCRKLLGLSPELPKVNNKTIRELMLELTGIDVAQCPFCQEGTMKIVAEIPKPPPVFLKIFAAQPQIMDSS
jgi:hypothetical protein